MPLRELHELARLRVDHSLRRRRRYGDPAASPGPAVQWPTLPGTRVSFCRPTGRCRSSPLWASTPGPASCWPAGSRLRRRRSAGQRCSSARASTAWSSRGHERRLPAEARGVDTEAGSLRSLLLWERNRPGVCALDRGAAAVPSLVRRAGPAPRLDRAARIDRGEAEPRRRLGADRDGSQSIPARERQRGRAREGAPATRMTVTMTVTAARLSAMTLSGIAAVAGFARHGRRGWDREASTMKVVMAGGAGRTFIV